MRKHLHRNTPKLNIPICIAAVLFCLTLFSTYFVSGLYARYTSSGRNGGSARVAVFSVKGDGVLSKPIAAELVPGEIVSKSLIIENDSEVAVEYTITVEHKTDNLSLSYYISKIPKEADDTLNDVKWETFGYNLTTQQIPGNHTDEFILYIKWEYDSKDNQEDNLDLIGQVDYITVTVTATQVD